MTPSDLPGMRLHRFLARWCRDDTMREIVDPSLGDMQREAHAALHRPWRRRLIVLSGHAGVVRAVGMNRVLAADFLVPAGGLLLLAIAGFAMSWWARTSRAGLQAEALLITIFLAPFVLRALGHGGHFGRLFAGSLFVGGFMVTSRLLTVMVMRWLQPVPLLPFDRSPPVWQQAAALIGASVTLCGLCAVAATVACRPAGRRLSQTRVPVLAALAAGVSCALIAGPVLAWQHYWQLTDREVTQMVVSLPSRVLTGTLLFAVGLGPALLLIRIWIVRRLHLASAAVLLSPFVLWLGSVLAREPFADRLRLLTEAPDAFLILALPVLSGAAAMGWMLAVPAVGGPHLPVRTDAAGEPEGSPLR